jgi:hypothetical protein
MGEMVGHTSLYQTSLIAVASFQPSLDEGDRKMDHQSKPDYVVPEVTTYTEEEILEELGPAETFSYG